MKAVLSWNSQEIEIIPKPAAVLTMNELSVLNFKITFFFFI
jgi:hypothetical protein